MSRIVLVAAFVALGFSSGASACINDQEQTKHEKEFRSQYSGEPTPSQSYSRPLNLVNLGRYGGGAALLVGAVALASRRGRART